MEDYLFWRLKDKFFPHFNWESLAEEEMEVVIFFSFTESKQQKKYMDKFKFIISNNMVIFLKNLLIDDGKSHAFYYLLLMSRTKTPFLSHSFIIINIFDS